MLAGPRRVAVLLDQAALLVGQLVQHLGSDDRLPLVLDEHNSRRVNTKLQVPVGVRLRVVEDVGLRVEDLRRQRVAVVLEDRVCAVAEEDVGLRVVLDCGFSHRRSDVVRHDADDEERQCGNA